MTAMATMTATMAMMARIAIIIQPSTHDDDPDGHDYDGDGAGREIITFMRVLTLAMITPSSLLPPSSSSRKKA